MVDDFLWEPPSQAAGGTLADLFVRRACLIYGDWNTRLIGEAMRMLEEHPELAGTTIYTAAAAGDVTAVQAILASDPTLVHEKGGALDWEPLLYACYSRLPTNTLDVARVLLEAGADPNTGFLWHGNVPPFTALTGAFGRGEDGNNMPAHPQEEALARLLLDAGADPNDGQTLYNRHFEENDDHLKLLFAYGLGQDKQGPWFPRLGDALQSPARMLVEELWAAARKDYRQRVRLLVEHGAEVNTPGVRDGRTPYESAIRAGNREIAEVLLQHGATKADLDPLESFASVCLAGRREEALALVAAHPDLPARLSSHSHAGALVHHAVEANRPAAVRLLAELGVALNRILPNAGLDRTPLHNAAWSGNVPMIALLLDLGADPNAKDPAYQATPRDWANHNHQTEAVAYFDQRAKDGG